ncbi:alpha/beta fold hydrolase [uncultured Hymenobacter sp.]|uniref:alpha/beta fold hydrolase n=1 Tax=uncultured Hymenobacter sp. TaxID=170016 RepID=UPI0035CC7B11
MLPSFVNRLFSAVHFYVALVVTSLLVGYSGPALRAQALGKQVYATTPDSVRIAIQEYGNPQGPEIVFIHGLFGSHLDWLKQLDSPLLRNYRLITYDLRGHGLSGKPAGAAYYQQGKRWGDELHTVLVATHAKRPIIVAWSMGGLVLTNYLHTYGDAHLAGLVYVGGVIELSAGLIKPRPELGKALFSPDLRTYLDATRQYLRQCFFHQPDSTTFALLAEAAAMALPAMTRAVNTKVSLPAAGTLPQVKVPVRLIYGEQDALLEPKMAERAQQLLPRAVLTRYGDTGHTPFFEQADRFNKELADFGQANARPTR